MNAVIVGKVMAGVFILTTTSISIVSWLDKELLGIYENVYLYMMSETQTNPGEDKDAPRSFECVFENQRSDKKFNCQIEKLDKNEKTKQHLMFLRNSSQKYKMKDLTTANNVFKVVFSGYKNIDTKTINKINVLNNNTKLATLKTLIGNYKGDIVGKPTHVIAQAKNLNTQITHDNASNHTCSWNNNKHQCEIYNFSAQEDVSKKQNFWNLLFQKPPTSGTTKIENDKHYLIKLNENKISMNNIKFPVIYEDNSDPKNTATLEYKAWGVIDANNDHLFVL